MLKTKQRYISNYLTHFVAKNLKKFEDRQYLVFKTILDKGILKARNQSDDLLNSHSTGFVYPEDDINNVFLSSVVCFADIPLTELSIHMEKYGKFGLSFTKDFLAKNGASPVFYISSETLLSSNGTENLKDVYNNMIYFFCTNKNVEEKYKSFFHDLHYYYFSFLKFWNFNLPDNHEDNYYFEREWRLYSGFKFTIDDISRIIIPKKFIKKFKEDFKNYSGEIIFADSYL